MAAAPDPDPEAPAPDRTADSGSPSAGPEQPGPGRRRPHAARSAPEAPGGPGPEGAAPSVPPAAGRVEEPLGPDVEGRLHRGPVRHVHHVDGLVVVPGRDTQAQGARADLDVGVQAVEGRPGAGPGRAGPGRAASRGKRGEAGPEPWRGRDGPSGARGGGGGEARRALCTSRAGPALPRGRSGPPSHARPGRPVRASAGARPGRLIPGARAGGRRGGDPDRRDGLCAPLHRAVRRGGPARTGGHPGPGCIRVRVGCVKAGQSGVRPGFVQGAPGNRRRKLGVPGAWDRWVVNPASPGH